MANKRSPKTSSPSTRQVDRTAVSGSYSPAGFIDGQLRRSNRNLLLINAAIALAVVAVAAFNWRYLYNCVAGPFPVDVAALSSPNDTASLLRYFVTIEGDGVIDTGAREVEQRKSKYSDNVESETVTAEYVALSLNDRLLLVKTGGGHSGTRFTGALRRLSSAERSQIIGKIEADEPEVRGAFVPLMLDATGFRGPAYVGLAMAMPLLAIAAWNLVRVQARSGDPGRHPITQALARFGIPQVVAAKIDTEVRLGGKITCIGSVTLTPSFLFRSQLFGLDIVSIEEVVWTYKKVTKHYYNFIPTGKTYSVMVVDRRGNTLEIPTLSKEDKTHLIIEEIGRRAPWVLLGYDDELARTWKWNADTVIRAVDQRRKQYEAAAIPG
ncbi:MAG TPA: DUF6709 family protein [Blastocatellia bacterium]|nr:DUF6709 family protein [Blastocatellia bacterium]